jgi:ribosome-associated protein
LICNGENERQLKALAENVAQDAKLDGSVPVLGIEGEASSGWVLVDFGDLIVHLFSPEQRNYFRLEDIWDQARVVMHIQ